MGNTNNESEIYDVENHRRRSLDCFQKTWPVYRNILIAIGRCFHISPDKLNNYLKTLFFLIILGFLFPINLLITLLTILCSVFVDHNEKPNSSTTIEKKSKRILVSGGMMTKALHLCRGLHRAGHQVFLVDTPINWLTGHRWSKSVHRFYVVPDSDEQPTAYIDTLVRIAKKEKIEMFIPVASPYSAQVDSEVKATLESLGCTTIHMDSDDLRVIDNKFTFVDQARSIGLAVPRSFLITSKQQLIDFDFTKERRPFICKRIFYDWLDRTIIVKLPRGTRAETLSYIDKLYITEDNPYVLQEYIQGDEYCTHGTCLDGNLTLYTCSTSSSWQLNYKHVNHQQILNWCKKYIRSMKITGHASFDFIVSQDDGKAYAIECNPRMHSAITSFYNHPNIADAYFRPAPPKIIQPLSDAREIYWLPHELWRLLSSIYSWKKVRNVFETIYRGREAIWALDDPLPFLLHYHVHLVYLLLDNLRFSRGRYFSKIDCCIGELT